MKNSEPAVLMYHGISSASSLTPQDREVGAELYDVSKEDFRKQMEWLRKEGYTTDLYSQGKPLIITFDDGEISNFKDALPILNEFGFKAKFFVIVKRIGKSGYMGWKELKYLISRGMTLGSHGLTHHILTNLLDSQIDEELRGSKRTLEINLGVPINEISIPRGFCNEKVVHMACERGYTRVYVSEKPHYLKSPCMARIAVKRGWSLKKFQRKVKGRLSVLEWFLDGIKEFSKILLRESGYNWLRALILKMVL